MALAVLIAVFTGFSGSWSSEVRNAYWSAGRIADDNPVWANTVRVAADLGDQSKFGRMGVYHFDYSSLDHDSRPGRYRWFYQTQWGPTYDYSLEIADGWKLKSEVLPLWTFCRGGNRKFEWRFNQQLTNPYVIPVWHYRHGVNGGRYNYFYAGLIRPFDLPMGLRLTPGVFCEFGDGRHSRVVYKVGDGQSRAGAKSLVFQLKADYPVCENLKVFAAVQEYAMIDHEVRNSVKRSCCRDRTIFSLGMKYDF